MDLSPIGQELYDLLYAKDNTYNPLEKYIIAIDHNLDDDGLLRAIALNIDIEVPFEENAAVYLYFYLKEYLIEENLKK
jgi:hypothetical protein